MRANRSGFEVRQLPDDFGEYFARATWAEVVAGGAVDVI
jgi:hypothetical protein